MKHLRDRLARLFRRPEEQAPTSVPATAGQHDDTYAGKLRDEIERFRQVDDIHALPAIFSYWADKYLVPMFEACGFSGVDAFYAKYLLQSAGDDPQFLSIGAGYCDTEMRVARMLRDMGLRQFRFECLELNPHLLERAREQVGDLAGQMVFTQADLNTWQPQRSYSGVMANHSLHHVLNLEGLFDNVKRVLRPGGLFITSDMIGRNGHQRWPEALDIVSRHWAELPDAYRYNRLLRRMEPEFINFDCSAEGFEGIRAQDILPLLLERFEFQLFVGFANVVSPFVDRCFGHNFDADAEWDRDFIDRMHALDEEGFRTGTLTPTQMLAVMTSATVAAPICARGLTPEKALRRP